MSFEIAGQIIGSERVFVIAEIGENHQGDIEIAKRMILAAKDAGADCVKFQKSCLKAKFTKNALNRKYDNSWGRTYGEHKEYLEFSIDQYKILQQFCVQQNILFTASAMDIQSLEDLERLNVPFIKIGSGDANYIDLLKKAATFMTPLIISTGMQNEMMINRNVDIMHSNGKRNFCLLHCVSAYPTQPQNVNLRMIEMYREHFPDVCLGYSGHELGIAISVAAVVLGAKIERHFTLDKKQKGTDHQLSLEPYEMKQLIARIRAVENKIPVEKTDNQTVLNLLSEYLSNSELDEVKMAIAPVQRKQILDCEMVCRMKLGKSLVYSGDLKSGITLTNDDICAKVIEPFGISAEYLDDVIGKTLVKDVTEDENVDRMHFCN